MHSSQHNRKVIKASRGRKPYRQLTRQQQLKLLKEVRSNFIYASADVTPSTSSQLDMNSVNDNPNTRVQNMLRIMYQKDQDQARELQNVKEELRQLKETMSRIEAVLHERRGNPNQATTSKPSCLPITSLEELEAFESLPINTYNDVVSFFGQLGGFTLEDAAGFALKESLQGPVVKRFTWTGDKNTTAFFSTRLAKCIFDSLRDNRNFTGPDHLQYKTCMQAKLRNAKETLRHQLKKSTLGNSSRCRNSQRLQEEEMFK